MSVLFGGLSVLLMLIGAAGRIAADTLPPRVYRPLIARDFEPAWRWYAASTPSLIPAPDHIALALDNNGQVHVF